MKKICLINNLFPPFSVGGAESVVFKIAQKNIKKGREVIVLTLNDEYAYKTEKTIENGIKIYRLSKNNIFHYKKLAKKNIVFKLFWHFIDKFCSFGKKEIKKILEEEKPCLVHTHNLTGVGFFLPKLIKKMNIEHHHTLHDVQLVEPSGILNWNHKKDSFFQKVYSKITKFKFKSPTIVYYPSNFIRGFYSQRDFFKNSLWRKTDNEFFVSNKVLKKSNLPPLKFLFVGALTKHKGIDILLKAWQKVSQNTQKELHIVGDGSLRKKINALTNDYKEVFMYGRLSEQEVREMYKKCDYLIFTSTCLENRPNVILEALENGLFVIASDTGGVRELLNSKNSRVFEPGNIEKLIEILNSY